ncbi:MAG TPA: hypothetical protein VLA51_13030 [Paracoccaceae bacterium]|nr:hypothetical protein [Paracoccaceae bacterium]
MGILKVFLANETGGITVEWVVLGALIVAVAIAALSVYAPTLGALADCNANVLDKTHNCTLD